MEQPASRSPRRGRTLLADLVLVAAALYLLARPGGAVRQDLASWWEARARQAAVGEAWEELVATGATVGPAAAPALVVFTDYRCPYCVRAQGEIDRLLERGGGARVVVRHLPGPAHPDAERLARISVCAEESGVFWEVHRALFESPPAGDEDRLELLLAAAGAADPAGVLRCAGTPAAGERVRADVAMARRLGLRATPTFMSRGAVAEGALSEARLRGMLEAR